jgi:uncharacterized membrane protein
MPPRLPLARATIEPDEARTHRPRRRRLAAWGAIGLLVIFTPAVIHIVANDVLPIAWPQGLRTFFRWFVPPHNVLFGLWARDPR